MYGFGPGHVDGVHNHLLEEPDLESVLLAAGFAITYVGATTYQLVNRDYRPICTACPSELPDDGPIHIPVTEVHATRTG